MASKTTLLRIKQVMESGDQELIELMNETSPWTAYKKLREKQGRLSINEKVARSLGVSVSTYRRAKAVVYSGDSELIKLMNETSPKTAYNELKRRQQC
jgi:hypothetical protein